MRPFVRQPIVRYAALVLIAAAALVCAPHNARAQDSGPQWRRHSVDDGLPANEVRAVFQTQDGSLWFGTEGGGVSRFDGRLQVFTSTSTEGGLVSDYVHCIAEALDGALWFGTSAGLSQYRSGQWEALAPGGGLVDGDIRALTVTDDGVLWAATGSGLHAYDGKQWSRFDQASGLAVDSITALWQDRDGAAWVGTEGGLNYCELRDPLSCIAIEELEGREISAVVGDTSGSLWVGTPQGILFYDGGSWADLTSTEGPQAAPVLSMALDQEGSVWAGTAGLGSFHLTGSRVDAVLSPDDGLPSGYVLSITRDRDGSLWFGTLGGVARYDANTWQEHLAGMAIMGATEGADRSLWFATAEDGVHIRSGDLWLSLDEVASDLAGSLPSEWVESILWTSDGTLWVGTPGFGLFSYDGQDTERYTSADSGLASDVVTTMLETTDGLLWLGTDQGLSSFDGSEWRTFRSEGNPSMVGQVGLALEEGLDGVLWVGSEAGVSRYDGTGWLEPLTTTNSGLAAPEVRSITQSRDGSVWLGTWAGGVNRVQGGAWTAYTVADGLGANAVFTILEDVSGTLWIGTLSGLTRFDGRTWLNYTMSDGLSSDVVLSISQDDIGAVWIGTESGLARYEADPGVPWARVAAVNGIPYSSGEVTILGSEILDIQFEGGDLRTSAEKLVYVCHLRGVDSGWYPCDSASLSGLSYGKHLFLVQARDEDMNYSVPVSLPIAVRRGFVLPWFGRSVRFPLSLLATIGALVVAVICVVVVFASLSRRDRQRRKRSLRRGFNPYISGEPIRRADMFFGRTRFIDEILRILHNNSLMIYGERRIGKTTLLYQLSNRLSSGRDPDYEFFPVLADLEGTTKDTFFHVVMDDIVRTCAPRLGQMPELAFDPRSAEEYGDRDFSRDLSTILDRLKATSRKEMKLILLMDEMDVVDTFGTMLQLQLRRIFMTTFAENLGAVVAGVKISRRWDRPESPWYNLFHEMRVPMFTDEEARQLITEPVRGVYRYAESAADRIIIHGKGRPYQIQRYCLESVNHMLGRGDTRILLEDVKAAHDTVAREWARYLRSARSVG